MFKLPGQRARRKLVQVIPVAQTQIHHGIAVTILSLNCYEHGYDVLVYVWCDAPDDLVPQFGVRTLYDGELPKRGGGSGPAQVGSHYAGDPHWYSRIDKTPLPIRLCVLCPSLFR